MQVEILIPEDAVEAVTSQIVSLIADFGLDEPTGDGPVVVAYRPESRAWRLADRAISINVKNAATAHRILEHWPR